METSEFGAIEAVAIVLQLGLPVLLLVATYFVGNAFEKRHYRSIQERETQMIRVPAINFRALPVNWVATQGELVTGSVVIAVDYFKRFLAGLRALIGGPVKSYESLLDRGRREAILRMKSAAIGRGYNAIINVRLETSCLASSTRKGQRLAGIEILAFGTAVKVRDATVA